MTGKCTRWQRWLPGSGGGLKVLNRNLHSFQLLDIIQVLDSTSWVRCASGNVSFVFLIYICIWQNSNTNDITNGKRHGISYISAYFLFCI